MKMKLILALAISVFLIGLASAEISIWTDTIVNSNASTVTMYGFISLKDTSADFITFTKPVPLVIRYSTQALPYNISIYYPQYSNAIVDWCNITMKHEENIFDTSMGRISNYSTTIVNYYITNQTSGDEIFRLHHEDILSVSVTCHYTNPNTLFIDSIYFGQFETFFPAHECEGCSKYTFEELTQENENYNEKVASELKIYNLIQSIVEKNYQLWMIFKWILRITLIISAVALIFAGIYFFYIYIKRMAGAR